MCGFLFSLLEIELNIVATFSEELAGQIEKPAVEFLGEVFGCDI